MKRGILFDKIEEADTDHKGHLRADVFVDASPFHDDKNDDRSDDGDPLFDLDPDGIELAPPPAAEVVKRERSKIQRRKGADPSRMARKIALRSGHQTGYKESPRVDFVEERRDAEKAARMAHMQKENGKLEAQGYRWPDEWKDRPARTVALNRDEAARGIGKPVAFTLKQIANRIGADPTALMFPRYMQDLTHAQLRHVVDSVKTKKQTASVWNFVVKQLDPKEQFFRRQPKITLPHVLRDGKPVQIRAIAGGTRRIPESLPEWEKPYVREPLKPFGGVVDHAYCKDPMEFGLIFSEQWMEDVEAGREVKIRNRDTGAMEPLVTKCVVTGQSLVHKKERGFKHWVLAPSLWGMSLPVARVAVNAAAVEAGLADGNVNYPSGERAEVGERLRNAVADLRDNPDAWCIIAIATNNQYWREQAATMIALRDALYFGMDEVEVEVNQRELKKLQKRLAMFRK